MKSNKTNLNRYLEDYNLTSEKQTWTVWTLTIYNPSNACPKWNMSFTHAKKIRIPFKSLQKDIRSVLKALLSWFVHSLPIRLCMLCFRVKFIWAGLEIQALFHCGDGVHSSWKCSSHCSQCTFNTKKFPPHLFLSNTPHWNTHCAEMYTNPSFSLAFHLIIQRVY